MSDEAEPGAEPETVIATARVILDNNKARPVVLSVPRDITVEEALSVAGWVTGALTALIAGERAKAEAEQARLTGTISAEEARRRIIIQ